MRDKDADTRLVTVAAFDHPYRAQFARMRLDAEGIESFLLDENIVTMNPMFAVGVGGIKLQVRESDAARAAEILGQKPIPEESVVDTPEEESMTPPCPECNSSNVCFKKTPSFLVFLSLLLLGLPLPFLQKKWICRRCGFSWEAK